MRALVRSMQGDHPCRTVLVASNDPAVAGLVWAADQGIPTSAVDHKDFGRDRAAFEENLLKRVLAAQPDILCLAGFMRILSPTFIGHFAGKMLNIHPSLLPKYPGLHTHARVLAAGDAEHGASVHRVEPVLDGGRILTQAKIAVLPDDTSEQLAERVLAIEYPLLIATVRAIAEGRIRLNEGTDTRVSWLNHRLELE